MSITVNARRCPQNHKCPMLYTCPVGAISQNGHGLPQVDKEKCIECGACINQCPMRAIEIEA